MTFEFTRKKSSSSETSAIKYDQVKPGLYICGLVEIKAKPKKVYVNNKPTGQTQPGVYFVFRSIAHKNGYVNWHVSEKLGERSSLYKGLAKMSGYTLDRPNEKGRVNYVQCENFLKSCLGKWFNVQVSNREFKKDDGTTGIWVAVEDNDIKPIEQESRQRFGLTPDCRSFFNAFDAKNDIPINPAHVAGEPAETNATKKAENAEKADFLGYPDTLAKDKLPWEE